MEKKKIVYGLLVFGYVAGVVLFTTGLGAFTAAPADGENVIYQDMDSSMGVTYVPPMDKPAPLPQPEEPVDTGTNFPAAIAGASLMILSPIGMREIEQEGA